MGLATERLYDPKKPLYFAKNTRFDGRDYKKGDEAPTKDMSQRTILKYFRTRLFVHKVRGKEPEKVVEETPKEVVEKEVEETPTQQPTPKKTRKRRTTKNTTD